MASVLNLNQITTYGLTAGYLQQGFLGLLKCDWPGSLYGNLYTGPASVMTYLASPDQNQGLLTYGGIMSGSANISPGTSQNILNIYNFSGPNQSPGFSWYAGKRISGTTVEDMGWSPYANFVTQPDLTSIQVAAPPITINLNNSVQTSEDDNVATGTQTTFTFLPGVADTITLSYSAGTSVSTSVVSGYSSSNSFTVGATQLIKASAGVIGGSTTLNEAWTGVSTINYSTSQTNVSQSTSQLALSFNPGGAVPNSSGQYAYTNSNGQTFTLVPNTQYTVSIQISTSTLITPMPNTVSISSPDLNLKDNLYGTGKNQNSIFMDFSQAVQQALNFGYGNLNSGLITTGPNANIQFSKNPDSVTYYGLVDGVSNSTYNGAIVIYQTVTSQSLQQSMPDSLKSGTLNLGAIANAHPGNLGSHIDVSKIWTNPSLIPEVLKISGGTGHLIKTGDRAAILSDISDSTFYGNGNIGLNLTASSNGNSLNFGNGNVNVNLKGVANNLFFGSGCNYVKVDSLGKNYLILDDSRGFNYVEINSLSSNTIISNWDGARDFLAFGDDINQSSLRTSFDPKTYTYTISAGDKKIATLVADSIDANLNNIFGGSIAKLSSLDAQLSDYGLINVLYGKYLNRAPNADSTTFWLNKYNSGVNITEIGKAFIRSQEYTNQFTNSSDFLKSLYHDSLGRASDSGGLQNWSDALQSGMTRLEVVDQFLVSQEYLSLIGQP